MHFNFNVDTSYLNVSSSNELAIVTYIQMYESIADQFVEIDDNDIASKQIVADSIKQMIEILSDIKKWEVDEKFHQMKIEYLNIMEDHYETLMKDINND